MRNLFLALLLANLLLFAWSRWVTPVAPPPTPARVPALVDARPAPGSPAAANAAATPAAVATAGPPATDGDCVQIGPLPAAAAASELARSLAPRGVVATPFAREGQAWMGNWVQLRGFASAEAAETARQQLVAGGLADAYVMQEGGEALISLGVFRDREGAERVSAVARRLGFQPLATDRYRPAVEYWLRARVPPGSGLARGTLALPGTRILRVEAIGCAAPAVGGDAPAAGPPVPAGVDPAVPLPVAPVAP